MLLTIVSSEWRTKTHDNLLKFFVLIIGIYIHKFEMKGSRKIYETSFQSVFRC